MEQSKPLSLHSSRSQRRFLLEVALQSTVTAMLLLFVLLVIVFASGCNRAVLVAESSPIRIGPTTRTQVYTLVEGTWVLSSNKVEIPEGWYCVPPSFVEGAK